MTPWPLIAQVMLFGDPLVVKANSRFAGAIHSVTWRGVEFVDHYDHGRELQVAIHVAGYGGGECYNPTEAGSQSDGTGLTSSSKVLGKWQGEHGFSTSCRLAFWTRPGETSPGCKEGGENDTVVSDFVLNKIVKLEDDGLLIYDAALDVPGDYDGAMITAPVVHLPQKFGHFLSYDPTLDSTYTVIRPDLPLLAIKDKGLAVAIWSDGAYQVVKLHLESKVVTISSRHNVAPLKEGVFGFRSYIAFGSVASVKVAISRAYSEKP